MLAAPHPHPHPRTLASTQYGKLPYGHNQPTLIHHPSSNTHTPSLSLSLLVYPSLPHSLPALQAPAVTPCILTTISRLLPHRRPAPRRPHTLPPSRHAPHESPQYRPVQAAHFQSLRTLPHQANTLLRFRPLRRMYLPWSRRCLLRPREGSSAPVSYQSSRRRVTNSASAFGCRSVGTLSAPITCSRGLTNTVHRQPASAGRSRRHPTSLGRGTAKHTSISFATLSRQSIRGSRASVSARLYGLPVCATLGALGTMVRA